MAETREHSYLFSLQELYDMEADRVRGETIRRLAEEQRRDEERRLAAERALAAERERAARLEAEQRRAVEEAERLRRAEELRVREALRLEHERELRDATLRHEQVLSQHQRDARVVKLRRWLLASVAATAAAAAAGGAFFAKEARDNETRNRARTEELARVASERDAHKTGLALATSERQRLERELSERPRVEPPVPVQASVVERPPPRPARPPVRRPPRDTKVPCTGDVNDPLNPCLPH